MLMKKMRIVPNRFIDAPLWSRLLIILFSIGIAFGALMVPILLANDTKFLTESVRARYEVGSLAESDVRARETFHYIDEAETHRLQKIAAESVLPIFRISTIETRAMIAAMNALFSFNDLPENLAVPKSQLKTFREKLQTLEESEQKLVQSFMKEIVEEYVSRGIFNNKDMLAVANQGFSEIQFLRQQGVERIWTQEVFPLDEVQTLEVISKSLHTDLLAMHDTMESDSYALLVQIIMTILQPNVYFAEAETVLAREQMAMQVPPVMVKVEKGEFILKKDFVITQKDVTTLRAMRLAAVQYSPSQIIGRISFIIIITITAIYSLILVFEHTKRLAQFLLIFLIGTFITQGLTYFTLSLAGGRGFVTLDPFLPVFVLPILTALLTNRKRAGMITAVLLSAYAVLLPSSNETTFFFIIAIAFCGIYFIRYVLRRLDMIFQWFFCIVAAASVVVVNNLINGYAFHHIFPSIIAMLTNISITFILVTVILPVLELIGNIPTTFRLRELAFSDSPALIRLSQTAVGTYNHSINVAEMAYNAAKAIDADPLLARVGGLYHDIGKMENPEYFIENQSGDNKHDDLKASLSVAIIKSHIKIGGEKGREAHLPQEVIDIITQHHGNDVITIFLKEAQMAAQADGSETEVKQQDYAYNSLIPQTPEAAIVMLADSIEAASRTVRKPSAQKYEKLIHQIIMGKIERKQLAASRLSLTDLDNIAKVFMQTLTGRYHSRIEYPEEKVENKK
jgi:putative nucleotidyltransferase with HDIG domain